MRSNHGSIHPVSICSLFSCKQAELPYIVEIDVRPKILYHLREIAFAKVG